MNRKNSTEKTMGRASDHPGISLGASWPGFWNSGSSRAALAENRRARAAELHAPGRACPSRAAPGSLKMGYCSDMRASGISSVTISPLGFAHRHAVAVGRAHHDAFHDRLAADEGFLAAFQDGHHLHVGKKAEKGARGHRSSRCSSLLYRQHCAIACGFAGAPAWGGRFGQPTVPAVGRRNRLPHMQLEGGVQGMEGGAPCITGFWWLLWRTG